MAEQTEPARVILTRKRWRNETKSTDVVTYLVVVVLLAGCAAVASILPARWAARLDPIRALREE